MINSCIKKEIKRYTHKGINRKKIKVIIFMPLLSKFRFQIFLRDNQTYTGKTKARIKKNIEVIDVIGDLSPLEPISSIGKTKAEIEKSSKAINVIGDLSPLETTSSKLQPEYLIEKIRATIQEIVVPIKPIINPKNNCT